MRLSLCITLNPTFAFLFLQIFLQFEAFDLQHSSGCSSDYIKIYNGNSKSSPVLLDKYCGKGPLPSLVASGSTMLVEFASDESITATGFRASYNRGMNTPLQSLEDSISSIYTEELKTFTTHYRVGLFAHSSHFQSRCRRQAMMCLEVHKKQKMGCHMGVMLVILRSHSHSSESLLPISRTMSLNKNNAITEINRSSAAKEHKDCKINKRPQPTRCKASIWARYYSRFCGTLCSSRGTDLGYLTPSELKTLL